MRIVHCTLRVDEPLHNICKPCAGWRFIYLSFVVAALLSEALCFFCSMRAAGVFYTGGVLLSGQDRLESQPSWSVRMEQKSNGEKQIKLRFSASTASL